jgi:hypothetical protein
MGSTLDRNDNQGTGVFLALVHGRDHSSGPGIGATAEMLFQTRTRFVSQGRYVDWSLLIILSVSQRQTRGNSRSVKKGSQNPVGIGHKVQGTIRLYNFAIHNPQSAIRNL